MGVGETLSAEAGISNMTSNGFAVCRLPEWDRRESNDIGTTSS